MKVKNFDAIRIKMASPEEILSWSHGEVKKPETINYRTQRAEKDGLFCERIFGPEKDYHCYCGKYKRIRYKGITCDRCGVEVTKSSVRRKRMGHINLAAPVSHIWFLKGIPSRMGMVLGVPMHKLERVIYFSSYIITDVDKSAKKELLEKIEKEHKLKEKRIKGEGKEGDESVKKKLRELKKSAKKAQKEIDSIKPLNVLSEVEYRNFSLKYGEAFDAGTGAETLKRLFEKLDLDETIKKLKEEIKEEGSAQARKKKKRRLRIFKVMKRAKLRPEWMFLEVLPVLPPGLRPMVQLDGGRYAASDLNDLYRRVINRNNRLKYLLDIGAPEVIVRNEKRMLQEAVDSLLDNGMRKGTTTRATTGGRRLLKSLADMLKGKKGRFRKNLLGKRVDYSGRSVIVVGPDLKFNQVGIPKKMALELFKPFVIHKILEKELAYNVRGASTLIEEETDEVWECLEEVVEDKLVLLNRAPTLHRLGIQAFYPVLIEGEAIQVHPMACKAFNADFDGDQMPVHVPLSREAQKEARERMLSGRNLLKPATGTPVVSLYQDIILGCYWLTDVWEGEKGEGETFANPEDAKLAYEFGKIGIKAKVKVRIEDEESFVETSVGRILFNEALPDDFPFQNQLVTIKKLQDIVAQIIRLYPEDTVETILDDIKDLGAEYSTLSGITWGMDDLIIPEGKEDLLKEAEKEEEKVEEYFNKGLLTTQEKKTKIISIWSKVKSEIEDMVPEALPKQGPVYQIMKSGARGSWTQAVQMCGMKGLVINPVGDIIELPVKSSFKEGFPTLEYFISTHGARKGTADKALRTSSAGYLTRRLIDVAHGVIIKEKNCGDKKGIKISKKEADKIGQNFLFKVVGRVCLEDLKGICKKGDLIDWKMGEKIVEDDSIKTVKVRSPISCKARGGVCQKCYGWDLGYNDLVKRGEAVGIVAAQAIGEPGTQLTMRTFHAGGVAGGGDITRGLPRVEEIFETRTPKGKAVVSLTDGKVVDITKDREVKIQKADSKKKGKKKNKKDILTYKIDPQKAIWVEEGQEVKQGQQLCEGSVDVNKLFKLTDKERVWRYLLKEIQGIYVSQGVQIHDKHIEIIIRQMFSRVKVKDPGDSFFAPGEIVEKSTFEEENKLLKKESKKNELATASPLLLGITKTALTTDSWLSAASFQETSRVLIKASTQGKVDELEGLKENVIIGKLIPAGTGFRKD